MISAMNNLPDTSGKSTIPTPTTGAIGIGIVDFPLVSGRLFIALIISQKLHPK